MDRASVLRLELHDVEIPYSPKTRAKSWNVQEHSVVLREGKIRWNFTSDASVMMYPVWDCLRETDPTVHHSLYVVTHQSSRVVFYLLSTESFVFREDHKIAFAFICIQPQHQVRQHHGS